MSDLWIVTWISTEMQARIPYTPIQYPRKRNEFANQRDAVGFAMGLGVSARASAELHLPGNGPVVGIAVIEQMYAAQKASS